jgi:type I restriction-modification system DNA methylase subunit
MTPDEVVNAIVDIAFQDILKDSISKKSLFSTQKEAFYVLDPTCGVGTFLTSASLKITKLIKSSNLKNKDQIIKIRKTNSFIGQDKVDRMVRMSKLNSLFYGLNPNNINQGNSIIGKSFIDKYIGKIDLIITNPPFGAEFSFSEMLDENGKLEILHKVKSEGNIQTINSELLMLDRSLRLLKPGGRLFIIVPDGVVSAGGLYETYRNKLSKHYNLKAVIDLPAVTFAQAGTRTKCSILYIQKPKADEAPNQDGIYMAVADEIGYEVKERQGSPVKFYKGNNDLMQIASNYNKIENSKKPKVKLEKPSIVVYPFSNFINGKWNANFYRAERIFAIESLKNSNDDEVEAKSLKEVAECLNKHRRKINVGEKVKCISVLHINEESLVKIEDVKKYKPTCAGVECFENEIIFSKINPRIPRVAIVPKIEYELTCSSEFAILKPFNVRYTYLLKQLLLTSVVQKQILSLTSGTSSSHNRIKESELMNVRIPWPKAGSQTEKELLAVTKKIEDIEKKKYEYSSDAIMYTKKLDGLICI